MGEITRNTDQRIKQMFVNSREPIQYTGGVPYGDGREVTTIRDNGVPYLEYYYAPMFDRVMSRLVAEDPNEGFVRIVNIGTPIVPTANILAREAEMGPFDYRLGDSELLRDGQAYIRTLKVDLDNVLIEEPQVRYANDPERTFMNLARMAHMLAYIREEEYNGQN